VTWTDPTDAVANVTAVTAAREKTNVLDNLRAIAEWTTYTPTITQSVAVAKTVTYAKYRKYGGAVEVLVFLTCTGAGTITNVITVSLPATSITSTELTIGAGRIVDAGVNSYPVLVQIASTTTVKFLQSDAATPANYVGIVPNFALGNTDTIAFFATYECT
jgi:hypothetical protein